MKEEKKRVKKDGEIASYNMVEAIGWTPVSWATSSSIVEMLLKFDDLEVKARDRTLLWHCAWRGILTEKIMTNVKIRSQLGQRTQDGRLPLEEGMFSDVCNILWHMYKITR